MHSSTFSALTIQFKLYAAYLFTAVLSFAASSCLHSTYVWEHHTQLHVLGRVRSGNGMETEWNGNGGNERKKGMAKLDYNNANQYA